jgi:hypothetical protein
MALPWSPYWDRNYFRLIMPALDQLLANHFVRGAISGLGVLNLLAGISELLPPYAGRR